MSKRINKIVNSSFFYLVSPLNFVSRRFLVFSGLLLVLASGMVKAQENSKKSIEDSLLNVAGGNIEKFRKGDFEVRVVDKNGKAVSGASVHINQISQDFLFGNLSEEIFRKDVTEADSARFTQLFTDLFNFTELTVKWAPYEPLQGHPEWQRLQQKIEWCHANGITAKGHTLGWTHEAGTPRWLQQYPIDQANILYEARIKNLVGGFKDAIPSWDVVNEPVNTIPWEMALKDTLSKDGKIDDGFRYATDGISLQETLPWVKKSFDWAYEADSFGDFVINEFYVIAKPDIREKYFQLIDTLLSLGTPVTGIGIQAHEPREEWFSPKEIVATFDRLHELGLPLHITEFTPQSSGKAITGGWRTGVWDEEAQAEFAVMFYRLAFGHPAMKSIHWWGLSDRWIWLQGGGLLDENLNPKPVYLSLMKLIKEEWMTKNITQSTDKNGRAVFRGFYGKYQVQLVLPNGKTVNEVIHVKEGADGTHIIGV